MPIMTRFGKIKPVNIKDVWPNEPTSFTPWLVDNLDSLGKTLGMDLEFQEQEAGVGKFSLDILAKDLGTGRLVVIENELKDTDHDHLGKLLTYAGGFDAGVLVWISTQLRDEHRKALEWLNEHTGPEIDCFGVVIEVIKIDDSLPAFNFKPVVFPNEWQKNTKRRASSSTSPKGEAYRNYFQGLIDELRTKHKFTLAKKAQSDNWYEFSSGITGVRLANVFTLNGKVRAEVYFALNKNKERNKYLFDNLLERKDDLEKKFGGPLEWERKDDNNSSRIAIYKEGTIEASPDELEGIRSWSITNLLKIKKVFLPEIAQILSNGKRHHKDPTE